MSELDTAGGRPAPATSPALAALGRGLASPRLGALLTIAAAAALGAGLIVWSLQPEYVPVGEQSSRAEALEIVQMLGGAGVDYRLDPSTGLVLVPKADLARVRMDLAAAGLGERTPVGLELLGQDQALGTSSFTETARYQHALETELGRTIASLRNIESARVHLALPEQSVFVRERGAASASVTLKARAGRSVEDEQVEAIVNLVASAIPNLETGQVTVVDQFGRLLSHGEETAGGATREHYDYARRLERLYSERIESLLTPLIGEGRVRAIVTAEVDFTQREQTEEVFDPDPAQLRSEQTETQVSDRAAAQGVPGALTNQPPGEGVVDPAGANAGGGDIRDESASTIRNFELDKRIVHTRQNPGGVLKLSAAVIIDDQLSTDEEGNPVRTPLSPEEIAEYTALAREAIGFDEDRGDSVALFNRAFRPATEVPPIDPLPLWQQDWFWTMVRQTLVGLAVILLVLLVLRPAVRRLELRQAPPAERREEDAQDTPALGDDSAGGSDDAAGGAAGGANAALEAPPVIYGDILNMARAMAAEDPKRVAKVVKDWVGEGG